MEELGADPGPQLRGLHQQILEGEPPAHPPPPVPRQLPAASVPNDPDGRAALYRSLVAGKRLLVVLDNARDSEHVLPLLPGGGTCTVLITSRHRLTGLAVSHAVPTLELDVFTDAEARELLARHLSDRRLRAEPDAVTGLLRWCGGLPLALGVIAARAATHPEFPLSVLVDELRDGVAALGSDGSGTNLRAVFDASVRVLPDAAATAFTWLAAAPGPDIALSAAAATLDVPPRRARELLRHLETGHLIRQHTPGRYRMHDLVRAYATERAHTDPRAALRVIDHYARPDRRPGGGVADRRRRRRRRRTARRPRPHLVATGHGPRPHRRAGRSHRPPGTVTRALRRPVRAGERPPEPRLGPRTTGRRPRGPAPRHQRAGSPAHARRPDEGGARAQPSRLVRRESRRP
ncbi:hypothetical protein GCM10010492_50690 [Saccharothrix mutabilis subsp. mutabilis]|uniref:NB-ARC domain-containing protein n=1 Tax=Saccharothrix mutabilis subsp. mutabilis TaxID=66855 RepID=A0ABP3DWK5_9PSEU